MKIRQIGIFCLLTSGATGAWADVLPTLIDPNNPAKVAREVPKPPSQRSTAIQVSTPSSATKASLTGLTPDTLIEVNHLRFIGGTRYSNRVLAAPYASLIGKKVPLKQLLAATQLLTEQYRQDGYILSYAYIPAKNFQQGTLNVVLVEGYIANSRIKSDNTAIAKKLGKLARKMMEEKPLTKDLFERYSILMSRIPDAKVTASANNPNNIYGATVLDVKSEHPRYWNLSSTLDSRKDEQKAVISGTLSGLTPYGEQLGVATMLPLGNSDNKENYVGLNYQQYLGDDGLQMQLKGSYYQKKPKKYTPVLVLPQYNVDIGGKTDATQYTSGIQFNYPLVLTRKKQWTVSGGLDYLDKSYDQYYRGQIQGTSFSVSETQTLRYPAAEVSLFGYQEYTQALWTTRLNVRQGIEGAISNSTLPATDIPFTRWRMNNDMAYLFAEKWRLSASIEGDWSDNDLPEPERVSFGGLRYGRGYPDGDASGDYGYGGQVEMRYLYSRESQWLNTVQPYVVMDTAHTYFNQPALATRQLASYAAGVTIGDGKHYSVSLEGARPIGDLPGDSDKRGLRFNATFTYNFNN
ncbi:ShlB/FhaC/HecB family hemolysin secretion/activation protein [Pragia fontium]|uniref:Hemolysin activation/secretion protein n=1 Tax=Pragia fontium DSM 5563 = ATCC 49100 TaxID=1122977 RepID=A0AAJ5BG16_9GAMM|nr:POTRA domain-containing protein [Pragia fontium]SFC12580.1 Hemolysin activation/secretion protein [Pragia fontium DSM 5563 = ATCC 49100]VEJ53551.1 Heme/hemopexin transporter protein huxB precursor [Pragia fontium]